MSFNEVPDGRLKENHGIEEIDFGCAADLFFWDTDFIDSNIPHLPLAVREAMTISPETFGLTAGMKPHPEKLVIKLCDERRLHQEFNEDEAIVFVPMHSLTEGVSM